MPTKRKIRPPEPPDERYGGRSHMWLQRKLDDDPTFPRPFYFGRLRFFKIRDLERWEREHAARAGHATATGEINKTM
jgi:hypothetical protein